MPDVRMPDGTIIRNVPENASRDQIMAAYQRAHAAGAVRTPQAAPKAPQNHSAWDGFVAGLAKTVDAPFRWIDSINPYAQKQRLPTETQAAYEARLREVKRSDQSRAKNQAMLNNNDRTGWQTAGKVVGSIPTALVTKNPWLGGAFQGAMVSDSNDVGGVAKDAAIGAVGGKVGDVIGRRIVAPAAARVAQTKPVKAAVDAAAKRIGMLGGYSPTPVLSKVEKVIQKTNPNIDQIAAKLEEAKRLGLPYSLADASPKTRSLAGSVSRISPDARQLAEETFLARALGQEDRATAAIQSRLAPITNIEQRSAALKRKAWEEAQPFYNAAYAHPAPNNPELAQMLNRPAGKEALKDAYTIAQNRGMNPNELGFIVDDTGSVGLQSDAGRYVPAKLGNARDALQGGSPEDLVTWIRRNGGLADSGGELRHMGIGNKPRSGMVGGLETKIGPLVHDRGMNFDDAALGAWEAGYFPELTDRPSINTFLDAVRGTHEGISRRFLPEDLARLDNFDAASAERAMLQKIKHDTGSAAVFDTSVPAGPDAPFAPMSARGEQEVQLPTMETMDLVKQALDGKLQSFRNPISGKLDLEGNKIAGSVNELLQQLKGNLDAGNLDYRQARGIYADAIKPREALGLGYRELPKSSMPQRQFDSALAGMNKEMLPEAQRGYATAMADQIDRVRLSGNPYDAVYGSPLQQGKVNKLFPEGSQDFNRIYNLENDMAKTTYETLGGSPTQARAMADQNVMGNIANPSDIAGALTNPKGAMLMASLRKLSDHMATHGEKTAADIAPILFKNDPEAALAFLQEYAKRQAAINLQRKGYGGLFGRATIPALFAIDQGTFSK